MKWLPLLWAALWRKPTRSIYTLVSITVAFLLVGIMTGVGASVTKIIADAQANMIMVTPRFGAWMPIAYTDQIARLDGVSKISIGAMIGGTYQTPDKGVGIIMTDARVVAVEPAFGLTPELFARVETVRNGVIINQPLADRLGWKEGETYPVETDRQNKEGNRLWTFQVVAVVPENEDRPGGGIAVGNYNYLNEFRADRPNEIHQISLLVDDAEQAPTISNAIERLFANSPTPVSATPLRTLIEQSIRGTLDLQFVIYSVSAAALFMILFLTGNVLAQ